MLSIVIGLLTAIAVGAAPHAGSPVDTIPLTDTVSTPDVSMLLEGRITCISAQSANRPVTMMLSTEGGYSRVLDSYLTPITYSGWHTAIAFEHAQQAGFGHGKWTRQLSLGLNYDHVDNRVGSNTMHHLRATGQWALMRRWHPTALDSRFVLMGGGMTWLHGGVIYNDANSNNPASVKLHWTLGLQGIAQFDTRLRSVPVTLRYQAALPIAGVWFSPEYDESYYEIYLGNHRHLAQPGWWGNRFDLDHRLMADFRLGGTILRVGYHGSIVRSWARQINTHITTHALVIGVGGDFLSTKRIF